MMTTRDEGARVARGERGETKWTARARDRARGVGRDDAGDRARTMMTASHAFSTTIESCDDAARARCSARSDARALFRFPFDQRMMSCSRRRNRHWYRGCWRKETSDGFL